MKKLSIENKIENLEKVARFIEEFGAENNFDQKFIFELNLILDELITNTIEYGYPDKTMHTINIELEKKSDKVELRIIDDGSKFNPLEAKEVDLNTSLKDKPIGGLGIHFVKQKADDLFYERKNDKNILTIIKRLNVNGE